MNRPSAICLVAAVLAGPLLADWRESLTPDIPGPFPPIRPLEAEYRIGWTDIEAARARAKISGDGPGTLRFAGRCATSGLARLLWQLDASLDSTSALDGLRTIYSIQHEAYAKYQIFTQIVARPDGIWCHRENVPPRGNPARWKRIDLSPLRDLFSGVLFIRSQNLVPGAFVSTIIFPGDCPFLVEIQAVGPCKIRVAGAARDAVKLDIHLRRINLKQVGQLDRYEKFQNGTIWLSDDADRIPLRVEIHIFVGYVFAELESVEIGGRLP